MLIPCYFDLSYDFVNNSSKFVHPNLEIEFLFYLLKNLPIKELQNYQKHLMNLQKKSSLSQRIKFLMQDLLDLLENTSLESNPISETQIDVKTETREIISNLLQEYPYHGDLTDILETIKEIK